MGHMSVESISEYREEHKLKSGALEPIMSRSVTSSEMKSIRSSRLSAAGRRKPTGRRTRARMQNRNLAEQIINPHHSIQGSQNPSQLPGPAPIQHPKQSSMQLQRGAL